VTVEEPTALSRKYLNGVSTMQTLIDFGIRELEKVGSVEFNLETVLRESGVSRGSLYHHFGNRLGLIARCEAVLLKQSLKADNEGVRLLISMGISGKELFAVLSEQIRMNGSVEAVARRQQRIRTLGMAVEDEGLRQMLTDAQDKGSRFFAETLAIAKDRGLIQPVGDLDALSYLIQSMFLGRILVDNTHDEALSDALNEATIAALEGLLNPQP
jgi:AcrR family transcriptional regulator